MANVTFASTTESNGLSVTLLEDRPPGLFRGSVALISATNPPTAGKLRVNSGDSVWVDYFDASVNATVRATATIDTAAPAITTVLSEADYQEATITWTTSEPANSVVQFGESLLLGR